MSCKTSITHCGDESKYETIAAIDQPNVRVIVNSGGTNERFDRAHLQNATIVQWSDNATIFDALAEGKAEARELREEIGLSEALICISIGIENVEDLISDLAQGLEYV